MQLFENTRIAFEYKNNNELKKAYLLFKLVGSSLIVKLSKVMVNITLFLRIPVTWAIKPPIYAHFYGGEMLKHTLLIGFLMFFISVHIDAQQQKRISTHLFTQTLQQGKVITAEADIYFEFPSGQTIMYSYIPEEFIYISNPLGETRLYKPKEKKMIVRANEILTSQNNNLYYFLINQTYDLGFKDLGFTIVGSKYEGEDFVTTWQAPVQLLDQVDKIDLVHENLLPIYAGYKNSDGKIVLKVYFESFSQVYDSKIPALITEIVYLPKGDSLIKRMHYTDLRFGEDCDSTKFNIEIPADVQIIK